MPTENLASAIASRVQGAKAALGQMVGMSAALQGASTVLTMLESAVQVAVELDTAIAQKRAEIAKSSTKAIDNAVLEGQQQRDKLIDEGRTLAAQVTAQAAQKIKDADAAVEVKRAELADLESKIAALKDHARGLAG